MKVTYNWLKDFVDIKLSAQALAEKLTMAGLEVTSLEEKQGDFVFEIEVTSNRPDWLSVIGIAREVAAITNSKLKTQNSKLQVKVQRSKEDALKIVIEDKKDCPLYTAKIIKDVKVGPSPEWLKKRLELVGCRSVNNVVDISNYVLFETGEPLHAFDLDKLAAGEIIVRRAKKAEKLTSIDGQELLLSPDILVIADSKKAVAIAGIMGGKETEVSISTKNILLEAAVFDPILVRRGKRSLGLDSESAYRFERGVVPQICEQASGAAAELIAELAQGETVLAKSSGLPKKKAKCIQLGAETAERILGTDIPKVKIKKILESLDFKVKAKGKVFVVNVPVHRQDINTEIDLIEELARIHGYENIPTSLPAVKPEIRGLEKRDLVSLVKNILMGLGLNEAITYSLMDKNLLRVFAETEPIEILNPLSKEQEILRPRLLPTLCRAVSYNLNQKEDYIGLFEVANVFLGLKEAPREELRFAIVLCGVKPLLLEQGLTKENMSCLHLKGILEALFERLGIKDYDFVAAAEAGAFDVYLKNDLVGELLQLSRERLEKLDIKNKAVFAAEISLEKAFASADLTKKFIAPAKYPAIIRDISFVVKEGIPVKEILKEVEAKAKPLLRSARISDYYRGKQIPAGLRGLTISCLYRSDERTLTEEEINPLHASVCSVLTERFGAKLR